MMVKMLNNFRGNLGTLTIYNDINIPLVYTQVVVIAVYAFFLAEIFTSQQINPDSAAKDDDTFDHYIPVFSIFKFILFMGWFKTAICLMNPFGDDANSIPTNEILDYNLMVGRKSGGAEDFLYPTYLFDEGEPVGQLDCMFDQLTFAPPDEPSDEPAAEEVVNLEDAEGGCGSGEGQGEGGSAEDKDDAEEAMLKSTVQKV